MAFTTSPLAEQAIDLWPVDLDEPIAYVLVDAGEGVAR